MITVFNAVRSGYTNHVLESAGTSLQALIVHLPSQLQIQWCHAGSLKLALVIGYLVSGTPRKSANDASQGFCLFVFVFKHSKLIYQHSTLYILFNFPYLSLTGLCFLLHFLTYRVYL